MISTSKFKQARTTTVFRAILAVVFIACLAASAVQAQAYSFPMFNGLRWTGADGAVFDIRDGRTYSVPIGTTGTAQTGVAVPTSQSSELDGMLYHISASTGSREFVADISGLQSQTFTWQQAGDYELDIYYSLNLEGGVVNGRSLADRVLALLIGNVVYAAPSADQTPFATIHFTINDSSGPRVDNVLFLPGIEGSRLYYRGAFGMEHQVWEPDWQTDIPYLALNPDGTSKYALYTKDVVDSLESHNSLEQTISALFGNDLQVYGDFEHFMDTLVASGTVKEWRAYPYDWRYDVRDIVTNGTPTEQPDGRVERMYLIDTLKQLASASPTGKVTIVAHSNGGLLAKALALALGADAPAYIDRIIMVGTPQWGTPEDVGAMLHGDGQTLAGGLVMRGTDARTVTALMPGAYGLLPSASYFSRIADPVVTFDTGGSLSGSFAVQFGPALSSFQPFAQFLEGAFGLDAQAGSADDLRTPIPLSRALIDKAAATHAALDAWTPPQGISVISIAGWGQDTIKSLAYTTKWKTDCAAAALYICKQVPYLEHVPVTTQDGDGTVVSPSAVGEGANKMYFDIRGFVADKKGNVVHQDLTSASPIQKTITDLLTSNDSVTEPYIFTTKPTDGANPITLRISTHSPVDLIVTDVNGDQSGVVPIPGTDFAGIKMDVPGSSVQVMDDEEYVSVPQMDTYHVVASGYASGAATLQVESIGGDGSATTTALFADIPTTASSTISLSAASGTLSAPQVDHNGDGVADLTAVSSASGSDPLAYLHYMRSAIPLLGLNHDVSQTLDERLAIIERTLTEGRHTRTDHGDKSDVHKPSLVKRVVVTAQLNALQNYIKAQVHLSVRSSMHGCTERREGMPTNSAEIILNMIDVLQSLL